MIDLEEIRNIMVIKDSDIIVKSSFGHIIKNWFLLHEPESESLVVLFPGAAGICEDSPLLHYARKVALLSACDVLSIEYGYARTEYSNSRDFYDNILNETSEAINVCNPTKYRNIYFIKQKFWNVSCRRNY